MNSGKISKKEQDFHDSFGVDLNDLESEKMWIIKYTISGMARAISTKLVDPEDPIEQQQNIDERNRQADEIFRRDDIYYCFGLYAEHKFPVPGRFLKAFNKGLFLVVHGDPPSRGSKKKSKDAEIKPEEERGEEEGAGGKEGIIPSTNSSHFANTLLPINSSRVGNVALITVNNAITASLMGNIHKYAEVFFHMLVKEYKKMDGQLLYVPQRNCSWVDS